MKRIGIWGAYKSGYISDDILYEALANEIKLNMPDAEIIALADGIPDDGVDFIIIGGGTMLGEPLHAFTYNKPFGVFGAGYRDNLNLDILKKAKFIYVRGGYSKRKLSEHGIDSEVIGDPVCLLSGAHIPSNIKLGMIPRNVPSLQSWLSQYKPDVGIILNKRDDSQIDGLNIPFYITPSSAESALLMIRSCSQLVSARCHPYFIAIMANIPAMVAQFEFHKVWDVMSGFGVTVILRDSVYESVFPAPRFPIQEQMVDAQGHISETCNNMKKVLKEICQKLV